VGAVAPARHRAVLGAAHLQDGVGQPDAGADKHDESHQQADIRQRPFAFADGFALFRRLLVIRHAAL